MKYALSYVSDGRIEVERGNEIIKNFHDTLAFLWKMEPIFVIQTTWEMGKDYSVQSRRSA